MSKDDAAKQEEMRIQKYSEKKNKHDAELEEAKSKNRKLKELEIKRFQDHQIEEKKKIKDTEINQRVKDHKQLQADLENFKQEQ